LIIDVGLYFFSLFIGWKDNAPDTVTIGNMRHTINGETESEEKIRRKEDGSSCNGASQADTLSN